MALTADPEPSYAGDSVTIVATVVPAPDGGTITWSEDGIEVSTAPVDADGRASIVRVLTDAGPHAYVAAYSGTDTYEPSRSEALIHDVRPVLTTTVTIQASAVQGLAGTTVTLTAVVVPVPPSGSVAWTLDGRPLATTPLDPAGKASLPVELPLGRSRVEVTFGGSPGFSPSAATLDLLGVAALPGECGNELASAAGLGVTADVVRSGRLTFYGLTASIDPATVDYASPPVAHPTWALWFRGLVWLVPLAVDAYVSGDPGDAGLVTAYIGAFGRDPDPGSSSTEALVRAGPAGWDEATNAVREQVLDCIVQIVPSPAASQLLDASIAANLDMVRYYGLPRHRPHNHGLMANLALIESARILDRPELIDAAQARMLADVAVVIDPCGMAFEQSATYQGLNASLWARAAATLDSVGRTDAAARLRVAAGRMADAYAQLVAPDGQVPPIGDGNPLTETSRVSPATTRMLCRSAGWAAARGSWTRSTTWYVLRFGPGRAMHGHMDHGSIVWYRGRSILVDPGSYFDFTSKYGTWYNKNAAHNVLAVSGLDVSGTTSLIRASQGTSVDTYTVRDSSSAVTRTRSVRVDRSLPLLVVLDRGRASRTRTFSQLWHFDPTWRWDPVGRRLVDGGARTGVVSMDLRTGRSISPTQTPRWVFPTWTTVRSAPMLTVSRTGTSASILSVVYLASSNVRPVIRWYPGRTAGSGVARIWWGRIHRDIAIDSTGMR